MRRVVVTGMGVVSPLCNTVAQFRDNLLQGKSGIKTLTVFDPCDLPTKIAGECHIENPGQKECVERKEQPGQNKLSGQKKCHEETPGYRDRKIGFAIYAAEQAMLDAQSVGMPLRDFYTPTSQGISMGIGLELFAMPDMIWYLKHSQEAEKFAAPSEKSAISPKDPDGLPERYCPKIDFLQTPSDLCLEMIREKYGFQHPSSVHISACAASTDAIGHAFLKIRRGDAEMMLAGGTDSMLNPLGLGGFCKLNALSIRNGEPDKASRPFDKDRDGFVLGEGAGILILENLETALRRKARIYAEVVGYGNSFDAYSISDPHPEGEGAYRAMQRALNMAGIKPERISYINAHGTSTPKNDPVETIAIKRVFGECAYKIPISSTKSMIGHLISAAGAVEVVASIACAKAGMVHPTINLENPDPSCDLDYVPQKARECKVDYFLKNSFAFGGMNASLVLKNGQIQD